MTLPSLAQKKARKLFMASSLVLALACAMALANTDDQSGSVIDQQAGSVQSEEQSGQVEMNQDPTLQQSEVTTGGVEGTQDTATSEQAGQVGSSPSEERRSTICSDPDGIIYSRGQAGFSRCLKQKDSGNKISGQE